MTYWIEVSLYHRSSAMPCTGLFSTARNQQWSRDCKHESETRKRLVHDQVWEYRRRKWQLHTSTSFKLATSWPVPLPSWNLVPSDRAVRLTGLQPEWVGSPRQSVEVAQTRRLDNIIMIYHDLSHANNTYTDLSPPFSSPIEFQWPSLLFWRNFQQVSPVPGPLLNTAVDSFAKAPVSLRCNARNACATLDAFWMKSCETHRNSLCCCKCNIYQVISSPQGQ